MTTVSQTYKYAMRYQDAEEKKNEKQRNDKTVYDDSATVLAGQATKHEVGPYRTDEAGYKH